MKIDGATDMINLKYTIDYLIRVETLRNISLQCFSLLDLYIQSWSSDIWCGYLQPLYHVYYKVKIADISIKSHYQHCQYQSQHLMCILFSCHNDKTFIFQTLQTTFDWLSSLVSWCLESLIIISETTEILCIKKADLSNFTSNTPR